MRIAMIGASGKVGRVALQHFYSNNTIDGIELALITPRTGKDSGLLVDIQNMLPLKLALGGIPFAPIDAKVADQYSAMKGANLVVVSAGLWPTPEQRIDFEKIDGTGRMVQSLANRELVSEISQQIAVNAPDAHVVVVTNQSDMMAEVAREHLPRNNVLGFGGIVDSSRLRMFLSQTLHYEDKKQVALGYAREKGHMIGYHNNEMIPLSSSLSSSRIDKKALNKIVGNTRSTGGAIAVLQRDTRSSSMATGASILPGYALYLTMAAYAGQIPPIEEAFNVALSSDIAGKYGVASGASLSVPIRIGKGIYDFADQYTVSSEEKTHLAGAQQRFSNEYAGFNTHASRPKMSAAHTPIIGHQPK